MAKQVAILAGGAGDLGAGVTRALANAGTTVAVLDITPSTADPAAARVIECDVADQGACESAVQQVAGEFGGIDVLVNMAQHFVVGTPLLDLTADDMFRSFDVGPVSAMRLMQLCHPYMKARGGGTVINFASGSGTGGALGQAAYAAAKEALRGLTKTAALEWGPDNIRVNAICPVATSKSDKTWLEWFKQTSPLRRVGDPESDIGGTVVFLAGPGGFITGRTLHVDGGMGIFR